MKIPTDDIGETNARFMVAEVEAEGCNLRFSHTLPSEQHPYSVSPLMDLLEIAGNAAVGVADACFALAVAALDLLITI